MPLNIANGTLETLKWVALLAMTIDHINISLFNSKFYTLYCLGRIALPLFAFIFAYNLARLTITAIIYKRVLSRLIFFGLIAQPAYMVMLKSSSGLPLNIMFTLFIFTACIYLLQKDVLHILAALYLFIIGQALVEYSWPGILLCMGFWLYCKSSNFINLVIISLSYILLGQLNENQSAMLSLPLIIIATKIDLNVTRAPYFFYIYYPLHLYLL